MEIPYLPDRGVYVIDLLSLLLLMACTLYRRTFTNISKTAFVRELIQAVLTFIGFIELFVQLILGSYLIVTPFLKILILVLLA